MNLKELLNRVDAATAQAFVVAARHMIDAMLIEAERVEQTNTPETIDYNVAELPRSAPAGGWISPAELRAISQRLAEAISAEKWTDGLMTALRTFNVLGGAL